MKFSLAIITKAAIPGINFIINLPANNSRMLTKFLDHFSNNPL